MVNLEPKREGFRAGPAGKAVCGRYGIRSQHRHYPYWYEGTLSTRGPLPASEYPCANPPYRPYCPFTYAYAWRLSDHAPDPSTFLYRRDPRSLACQPPVVAE